MAEQVSGYPAHDAREAYGADYYLDADGQPQKTFAFNDLTLLRAQAIAKAMNVPSGGRILDYGCGLGALTAAFSNLGYDAVGIDPSPHAVEHAVPQAQRLVRHVGRQALFDFDEGIFDLVVAKDVFEHIDERRLHDVADRLLCIGGQVLAIIPVVNEDRKFVFSLYDDDPTHITRLTRNEWLGFFPYTVAEDYHELTPMVRRADKVAGTLCLRLAEPDVDGQSFLDWARTPQKPLTWHQRAKRFLAR